MLPWSYESTFLYGHEIKPLILLLTFLPHFTRPLSGVIAKEFLLDFFPEQRWKPSYEKWLKATYLRWQRYIIRHSRDNETQKWISCNFRAAPRMHYYVAVHYSRIVGYIHWTQRSGFRRGGPGVGADYRLSRGAGQGDWTHTHRWVFTSSEGAAAQL